MKSLSVNLAERSYPIHIGQGVLAHLYELNDWSRTTQILIVTNTTIAPIYLDQIKTALTSIKNNLQIQVVILPDGEQHKNWITLNLIYDSLMQYKFERASTLVALGGGVVGDITGFAAATYQRGVNFIQIPTTLLSQVDSSVGGKTGINHPLGKNMIGSFYQPKSVIIDINTLTTLPDREFFAGMAEVIKYGLIIDADFFSWLEQNMHAILDRQSHALIHAIERSCLNKALIVASDEKESGQRALLNLGHTFGHAIETHVGYGRWLHGEAVASGIMIAACLSQQIGWLTADHVLRIKKILQCAHLPVSPPQGMSAADFFEKMQVDKKVVNGKIRYVLLKSIGTAVIESNVAEEDVITAINQVRS